MKTRALLSLACFALGFGLGKYEPYTRDGFYRIVYYARKAIAKKTELPTKAIPFEVTGLYGNTATIGHAPWKDGEALMILHVWGPWCAPCRAEFPAMVECAEANPDIWFVTISVNSETKYVSQFLDSIHFKEDYTRRKLLVTIGSEKDIVFANDYYQIDIFPTTLFLDKEGNIVKRFAGVVDWHGSEVKELLNFMRTK